MEEDKRIDYKRVIEAIWKKRNIYVKTIPITVLVAIIWIMPQPRYYSCSVMLAPEGGEDISAGSLSSLASSFGFNMKGASDAIYPMLYPDLFQSPEFVVSLLDIHIHAIDEDDNVIDTDYYTYLTKYQKKNWLTQPFVNAVRTVKSWIKPKKSTDIYAGDVKQIDSFMLSSDDYKLVESISELIQCTVDKKTDVVTINVTDQNRIVCALIADSVKSRLQVFITKYRTSKARQDLEYYQGLVEKAKQEYDEAIKTYGAYADTHQNMILQSYIAERDKLENNMALKYETYTAMLTQLEAAKAKVQERTPAFTTLRSASVPIKPAGPKRMMFVIMAFIFAFVGTTGYIIRKIL